MKQKWLPLVRRSAVLVCDNCLQQELFYTIDQHLLFSRFWLSIHVNVFVFVLLRRYNCYQVKKKGYFLFYHQLYEVMQIILVLFTLVLKCPPPSQHNGDIAIDSIHWNFFILRKSFL